MDTPLAPRLRLAGAWNEPEAPVVAVTPAVAVTPRDFATTRALDAYAATAGKKRAEAANSSADMRTPAAIARDASRTPAALQSTQSRPRSQSTLRVPPSRGFVQFNDLAALRRRENALAANPALAPPPAMAPTLAPALTSTDARWVLAVLCSCWLEGGAAAILTPAKREKLMRAARSMGLRLFDASLIVAIVQDDARHGMPGLSAEAQQRLAMIRPAAQKKPQANLRLAACVTLLLAAALAMTLAAWVGG